MGTFGPLLAGFRATAADFARHSNAIAAVILSLS
ncbi:MAG: hypothetical protein ACI8R4_003599, partial [Paracoccaceae bacterium]